ncbi:hypothetical protein EB796_009174 [Bugula neritina]|uniref:Uncharacterized protein n=1 Tax=Bugula neritina TaxID=10212 RepID=A0A7J7K300_BUGNE|nr:hypothetical protein EB796_009174 [Bugula neritina]
MQQQSPSPASLHRQVLLSQSGQIRKNNSARSLDTVANQCGPIGDVGREFSSAHDIPQYEVECEGQRSASTERLLRKFLHATPDVDRPMYRKDIYYTGSVQILPEFHDDINSYVASITEIQTPSPLLIRISGVVSRSFPNQ